MKLVIVMRRDLHMSPGKMIAQAVHAAESSIVALRVAALASPAKDTKRASEWIESRKVVVLGVDSETEFAELFKAARAEKIPFYPVVDAGHTEVPPSTLTCAAFGPWASEVLDRVTGGLRLL